MRFYVVYFNNGYYVSYKDKCDVCYSLNVIEAKRYKSLDHALNRAGLNSKGQSAINELIHISDKINNNKQIQRSQKIKKLNNKKYEFDINVINSIDNLFGHVKIEIVEVYQNSCEIIGSANVEIYNYVKEQAKKQTESTALKSKKLKQFLSEKDKQLMLSETKTATQDDIDDFCS